MRHQTTLLPLAFAALLVGAAPAHEAGRPPIEATMYAIDNPHSAVEFTIRFMGLTKVRGRFTDYRGTVMFVEQDPARSSVSVVIRTESIDTDNDFRDKHLRSPDFFDAEKYPLITFQSTGVEKASGGFQLTGPLTIHGVTREVTIPFTLVHGRMKDGWDNTRIGFLGSLSLNRKDFGVVGGNFWNRAIDLDRLALSDEVEVELAIQGRILNMERISFDPQKKPSIGELLMKTISEQGIAAGVRRYAELKASQPDAYNFGESELNTLGYKLLQQGRVDEAVEVLKLNAATYPESANVYDSLGEAYAARGETELAIENYRKTLTIDPHTTSAIEMLRWLEGRSTALTLRS